MLFSLRALMYPKQDTKGLNYLLLKLGARILIDPLNRNYLSISVQLKGFQLEDTEKLLYVLGPFLDIGHVRLSYKPYCFSEGTVFFSHNESANSTFSPFQRSQAMYVSSY